MREYSAYRSPIRLVDHLGLADINPSTLKQERKRILLEIQLSPTQTIVIDGKEHTKNDVLSNFQELEAIDHLELHYKIAQNTYLLNFLENQQLPPSSTPPESIHLKVFTPYEIDLLRELFSNHLTYSLQRVMGPIISNSSFEQLTLLLPFFSLLQPHQYKHAFSKLIDFNNSLHIATADWTREKAPFHKENYAQLFNPALYPLVNFINHEVDNFSEKLAISLVNISVYYQRAKGRKDYLVQMMAFAKTLDCSEKVQAIIIKNQASYRRSTEQLETAFKRRKRRSTITLVTISILWIAFILYKCSS